MKIDHGITPAKYKRSLDDGDEEGVELPTARQQTMLAMMPKNLSPVEQALFRKQLVEFIVMHRLPFSIVESEELANLLDCIRPNASKFLPGRTTAATVMLDTEVKEAIKSQDEVISSLLDQGRRPGLVCDDWEDATGEHIEGITVSVGPDTFAHGFERGHSDHHGIAEASVIEEIIKEYDETHGIKFAYVCTDDAGQLGRARRILALRYPHLIFICCFAHQVNLMVAELLKVSEFSDTVKAAVKASTALNLSKNKWLAKFKVYQLSTYGPKGVRKLYSLAATRWNSVQMCLATQQRSKKALQRFVNDLGDDPKFPEACRIWNDNAYWIELEEAELLIWLLVDPVSLMQRNGNNIAHVYLMYLNIYPMYTITAESNVSFNDKASATLVQRGTTFVLSCIRFTPGIPPNCWPATFQVGKEKRQLERGTEERADQGSTQAGSSVLLQEI